MLQVAEGKRTMRDFERLFTGGERSEAGPSVAARGLTLVDVGYDDLDLRRVSS
jgi:tRNA U38,U39,U40 pseudouridine synthase TruA